jgi:threonine-phosphate decarboxylase
MLYGHGDDGYQYGRTIVADFSTNVWWGGEPAGLKEQVFGNWESINRYPEVLAESFREEVAVFHDLSPRQVLVCNGTAEAIYLIAQAFRGSRTAIAVPTFAEYEDACRLHQHDLVFLDWQTLKQPEAAPNWTGANFLFLCNPNNPTGDVLSVDRIEALLRLHPQTIFVVDEAYIGFTEAVGSAVGLLSVFSNLILLRSLTKTFAIPGLRLGYVLASAALIDRLSHFKYPWSVNSLAVEAGKFILRHYPTIQPPLRDLLREKVAFVSAMAQLKGFRVGESHTHYFLVEMPGLSAAELKRFLIDQQGILIRDAGNFRTLNPGHFRVATLSAEKNQLLIQVLAEWIRTS